VARTPRKERIGRGRLSRLDTLPEIAEPDLVWLNQELRDNKRPQTEIRDLFNMRLAAHGIEPISNGSFSRYTVRKAMRFRELDEQRRLSVELAEMLGTDSADKMTIALGELIKMASFKLVEQGGLEPMDIMSLARASKDVVGAQKQSADYRRVLEDEHNRKLAATLTEVEKAVAKAPMDANTVLAMIRKAYGWTE
jgi:hypothetical protein